MTTDRVLIEVTTAANLAGIKQAQAGMLQLNAATIALTVTLGAIVIVGRAAMENTQALTDANDQLSQAYATQKDTLAAHEKAIEDFIQTNQEFISNQYDVRTALATVVRAGHDQTTAMRILNDALDMAAIKHEDVSKAAQRLILVLAGNSKALRELGITTEQYNAIMKSTMTTEEKQNALMTLYEQRIAGARNTTNELAKSQNSLNIAWQDFTVKIGPGLLATWAKLNQAAATGLGLLSLYYQLLGKIGDIERSALSTRGSQIPTGGFRPAARASGGSVMAGSAYTVGEHGPETLVMGSSNGTVIPNGAGGTGKGITVNVIVQGGFYSDGPGLDRLTMAIANRLSYVTGR